MKSGKPVILVVDDDPVTARLFATWLDVAGYLCVLARNGNQALAIAEHKNFELCLVDLHMPGLKGLEVCQKLRRLPGFEKTPLLLTTGHLPDHLHNKLEEYGINGLLLKPFELASGLRLLERHLAPLPTDNPTRVKV